MNKHRMISVDQTTFDLLREVKEEFLRHHPEMQGYHLSKNFLIRKAIDHYLQTE